MSQKSPASDAVRMLPDFCWMTFQEVLSYVEQIFDVDEASLGTILHKLVKAGQIERKQSIKLDRRGGPINIYLYKKPSTSYAPK